VSWLIAKALFYYICIKKHYVMKNFVLNNLSAIYIYIIVYFSPVFPVLFGLGFIVLTDFVTGMLAAKKRGEVISSRKMRPTVTKGIGYMAAILVAHTFEKSFMPDLNCLKIVSGLIALIELKSLDENIKDLTGKSLFKQFFKEGK